MLHLLLYYRDYYNKVTTVTSVTIVTKVTTVNTVTAFTTVATVATVTKVTISDDLRNATVYYSVLGGDKATDRAKHGLRSAHSYIRGEIANRIGLRYAPVIFFKADLDWEKSQKVVEALKTISGENEESPVNEIDQEPEKTVDEVVKRKRSEIIKRKTRKGSEIIKSKGSKGNQVVKRRKGSKGN
jgi:ribosome-binding factor A